MINLRALAELFFKSTSTSCARMVCTSGIVPERSLGNNGALGSPFKLYGPRPWGRLTAI